MKTVFVVTVEHEDANDIQIEGSDIPTGHEAETFERWLHAAEAFGHRGKLSFSVSTLSLVDLKGADLEGLIEGCDKIVHQIADLVTAHDTGSARAHLANLVSAAYRRGLADVDLDVIHQQNDNGFALCGVDLVTVVEEPRAVTCDGCKEARS